MQSSVKSTTLWPALWPRASQSSSGGPNFLLCKYIIHVIKLGEIHSKFNSKSILTGLHFKFKTHGLFTKTNEKASFGLKAIPKIKGRRDFSGLLPTFYSVMSYKAFPLPFLPQTLKPLLSWARPTGGPGNLSQHPEPPWVPTLPSPLLSGSVPAQILFLEGPSEISLYTLLRVRVEVPGSGSRDPIYWPRTLNKALMGKWVLTLILQGTTLEEAGVNYWLLTPRLQRIGKASFPAPTHTVLELIRESCWWWANL